jgi:RNA polymerase sigma-70 factor (ECF subfamily)
VTDHAPPPATLAQAREEFLAMIGALRPELHRYCARLTGSVIEGEDIVQDALARAFYALSLQADVPALRPWLFRIAHNAALDHLKRHGRKYTDLYAEVEDVAGFDERPEPAALRAALARFLALPVAQRSAVILKDVLGHSLEETAEIMETTVMAIKAALVRGRSGLREAERREPAAIDARARESLDRYASLFNARDWEGLRALVAADCKLDLVSKSQRRGKAVGMYFTRYEREDIRMQVMRLEGRLVLAAFLPETTRPSYFLLLDWEAGLVTSIRDFRYVPYIASEAELEPA